MPDEATAQVWEALAETKWSLDEAVRAHREHKMVKLLRLLQQASSGLDDLRTQLRKALGPEPSPQERPRLLSQLQDQEGG
jgi:hypothetical protein